MNIKLLSAMNLMLLITACGGGSSGGGASPPSVPDPEPNPIPDIETPLSGFFIDSSVSGLTYKTASTSGTTDADGKFTYLQGQEISFYIGESFIGKSEGGELITPLELFGTTDLSDTAVINLARLLQTLDNDADPVNGIEVSSETADVLTSVAADGLDFSDANFAAHEDVLALLASLSIDELVPAADAFEHLSQSINSEYAKAQRGLPIPAFNAHIGGRTYYSNVYDAEDDNAEAVTIDTLADGQSLPRYDLPYGAQPFFDFTASDTSQSGIGIAQSYIWVDDVLSDNPQLKINLFGLDRAKLLDESLGLAYRITGTSSDGSEYTVTTLVDPDEWRGTILVNNAVVWDEVGVLGAFYSDANRTSLWLPLQALDLNYSNLTAWKKVEVKFFIFNLANVSVTNPSIVHSFPAISSSFEEAKVLPAQKVHLTFTAYNQRSEYPPIESSAGCNYQSEVSFVGDITWEERRGETGLWRGHEATLIGVQNDKRTPDITNFDGTQVPCDDDYEYAAASGFTLLQDQQQITLRDMMRLFTPKYNETLYDNAGFLVPQDVVEDPNARIDTYTVDPITQQITISGQSPCSEILICVGGDFDEDVFDWTLSLTPVENAAAP
ncbi:hypothetical protein [Zhongshania aquimaris]|uniref:Carboxypeptidase regulatory-like domain-containing protein n=1 Tax=Zhongshania aquimaris TaxID=2857107 RepID=A0ABS6VU38_9GAMM|nr:hypothetical protein [Zhongshania aquimaris]MBW2941829.1 hypothetical protein [Zhongshania aquimaris]